MKTLSLSLLAFALPCLSTAAVREDVIDVPVAVTTIYGQEVRQPIKVTVFHDDQRERAPYLVLNHGRPGNNADFSKLTRQRFAEHARYFVGLGFTVFVPTRVGYGHSGGPDVEYSGACNDRRYAPVYAAAASQTLAVLQAASSLPYADTSRGIVVGQSFGGLTSVALSAMEVPGLVGAVNFAGGGGGNPAAHPERPCSPHRLDALVKQHGAHSKVPMLWLYSENDRYWGQALPKEWFETFVQAGGKARFVQLPPYQDDGHKSFVGNPAAWKPAFEGFIHELGF